MYTTHHFLCIVNGHFKHYWLQALKSIAEGGENTKEIVKQEIWQRRSGPGVKGEGGRAIPKEVVRSLSEVNRYFLGMKRLFEKWVHLYNLSNKN